MKCVKLPLFLKTEKKKEEKKKRKQQKNRKINK